MYQLGRYRILPASSIRRFVQVTVWANSFARDLPASGAVDESSMHAESVRIGIQALPLGSETEAPSPDPSKVALRSGTGHGNTQWVRLMWICTDQRDIPMGVTRHVLLGSYKIFLDLVRGLSYLLQRCNSTRNSVDMAPAQWVSVMS